MSKRLDWARTALDATKNEPDGVKQGLYFQNSMAQSLLGILEAVEQLVEQGQDRDNREYLAESVAIYGGPRERFDAALAKGGRL